MQVLKEELREKIIEKATVEFMEHGFEKASLRKIVKEAGTTIGNFYNYFKNKEDVFYAITTPVYDATVYVIQHHDEDQDEVQFRNIGYRELRDWFAGPIQQYVRAYDKVFVILIDGSRGTRYENVKEELIKIFAEHIGEHLEHLEHSGTLNENEYHINLPHVVAAGFLEGVLKILRGRYTQEEKEQLLLDYLMLYAFALLNMLGPEEKTK